MTTACFSAGVSWSTETFDQNPDANALRWGTLYNFRFDADVPPTTGEARIGLFEPGTGTVLEEVCPPVPPGVGRV